MNSKIRATAVAVVAGLAVAGCVSAAEQQKTKMETQMGAEHGRRIADIALRRGPPQATFSLGGGRTAFQWELTAPSTGAVIPIGGMAIVEPPRTRSCRFTFIATATKPNPTLADYVIVDHAWVGDC